MRVPLLFDVLPLPRTFVLAAALGAASCGEASTAQLSGDGPDAPQERSEEAVVATPGALTLNKASSYCVDVQGGSSANGTTIQLYRCNNTKGQLWRHRNDTLRTLGKCLTVDANPTNGSKVRLSDCVAGQDTQQFVFTGSSIAMHNHNLCIDLPNGTVTNGAPLQVWSCTANNTNQAWTSHIPASTVDSAAHACKRGIAYGGNSAADLKVLSKGLSWWYNWSSAPEAAVSNVYKGLNMEFVPMVWGGSFNDANLIATISGNYLLAFNEPNFNVQSNLTPSQAAALWPRLEAIAKAKNLKIVSPAVNYCGGGCNETSPFDWLDQFFAACRNCQIDYVAFHWYACSKDALTYELGQFESRYKRPVWLTEFSCMDSGTVSDAVQQQYLEDALAILEADANVFRYAWFTGRNGSSNINLLGADGQLSNLGKTYVNYPQACTR